MFDLNAYLSALAVLSIFALAGWILSLVNRDVSIVDSLWSVFLLAAAVVYTVRLDATGPRVALVLAIVLLWAIRLSAHVTWRNHGMPEDHRYQAIRRNNQPNFELKSLYIVFGLQAVLAWIVSIPLLAAIASPRDLGMLDAIGAALGIAGFLFETVADWQLARFKSDQKNHGQVMDRGLWRYTRHPNYFGEFCVWWGFYLIAFAAGGWWSIIAPLLMSLLLLRVSGVALLEKDIAVRRPAYRDYIARTNAFFPGMPRAVGGKKVSA